MKLIRYSLVCCMCALVITVTGCTPKTVVNTNSGVVIHSNDFTGNLQKKVAASSDRIRQVNTPTAKSTGQIIRLGDGYEKIEMGPLFDAADRI